MIGKGQIENCGSGFRWVAESVLATHLKMIDEGTTYPKIQILTIQQILDGKQPQYPLHRRDATFKKAPRSRAAAAENLTLPLTLD